LNKRFRPFAKVEKGQPETGRKKRARTSLKTPKNRRGKGEKSTGSDRSLSHAKVRTQNTSNKKRERNCAPERSSRGNRRWSGANLPKIRKPVKSYGPQKKIAQRQCISIGTRDSTLDATPKGTASNKAGEKDT